MGIEPLSLEDPFEGLLGNAVIEELLAQRAVAEPRRQGLLLAALELDPADPVDRQQLLAGFEPLLGQLDLVQRHQSVALHGQQFVGVEQHHRLAANDPIARRHLEGLHPASGDGLEGQGRARRPHHHAHGLQPAAEVRFRHLRHLDTGPSTLFGGQTHDISSTDGLRYHQENAREKEPNHESSPVENVAVGKTDGSFSW